MRGASNTDSGSLMPMPATVCWRGFVTMIRVAPSIFCDRPSISSKRFHFRRRQRASGAGSREHWKAHDVLARLEATAELSGTREEMRERGVRPPPRTISTGAAGLTGREIEIARMVATRKSNKEIGGALQISSRTVSTHLSNIFVKLSVGSRGELADFVRQNGLLDA